MWIPMSAYKGNGRIYTSSGTEILAYRWDGIRWVFLSRNQVSYGSKDVLVYWAKENHVSRLG